MTENNASVFTNGDRVSHKMKGLGTVKDEPQNDGLIVPGHEEAKSGDDLVYVVWDDDRLPVGKVASSELEPLSAGVGAISTGF